MVLYTIDSNLGILQNKKLLYVVLKYFKEFPLWRRPVSLSASSITATATVGKPKLRVKRNPTTVEEKLDYLQDQINDATKEFEADIKEVDKKIEKATASMKIECRELEKRSTTLENKINQVSVGGLKTQVFGVSLMIYGAITGYMA